MPQQLGLNLPGRTALGRDDFLLAPANQIAVAMIDQWPDWPGGKLVLSGPEGSGKTHLTHVWASRSGANIISARDLAQHDIAELSTGPLAVEDVPEVAQNPAAQTALFHLHNLVLAEGHSLLLTGAGAPQHWPIALPDLASRLAATPVALLEAPDDALLSMVLLKLFADRQLTPKADLIPYLIKRMDRSFASAREIVATLDRASLAAKRPVTRRFAADVLDNSGQ